jgi:hypothetical protein
MTTQPEALRLADLIDNGLKNAAHHDETAAELRRLHAVNQELLVALKAVTTAQDLSTYGMALHNARAAIAKAEAA